MNIRHLILTSFMLTSPSFIQSESLLHEFGQIHPIPPLDTILNFFREYKNKELCRSISFKLHIERTELTSPQDWTAIMDTIDLMIKSFRTSEYDSWLNFLGKPIQNWHQITTDKKAGIHGRIIINTNNNEKFHDANKITIKLKIHHDNTYDSSLWNSIFDESLAIIEKQEQDINNKYLYESLFAEPLPQILSSEHIKKHVSITWKDTSHGKLALELKNKK